MAISRIFSSLLSLFKKEPKHWPQKRITKHSLYIRLSLLKRKRRLAERQAAFFAILYSFFTEYLHIKSTITNEELITLLNEKKSKKQLYASLVQLLSLWNEIEYKGISLTSKELTAYIKQVKQLIKAL